MSAEPVLEPLSLMAALAAGTQRMRFGTNVLVLQLRDPIVVAKQCATIDYLSGGRFIPSFGVGSDTAVEWRATGHDRRTRGARMDEALTVMEQLLTGSKVTFEGTHYHLEDAQISPLPVQQPFPLWIGGSSDAAVRRTARIGTGWLGGGQTVPEVAVTVAAIRDASAAAGRPLDPDHYGIGFAYRFGGWDDAAVQPAVAALARQGHRGDPAAYLAVGDASTILARIQEFRDAGISKFVLRPISSGAGNGAGGCGAGIAAGDAVGCGVACARVCRLRLEWRTRTVGSAPAVHGASALARPHELASRVLAG